MDRKLDKDQIFNEARRLYLTKQIGSDVLLKRLHEIGESLAFIPDHDGRWALAPVTWARFDHKHEAGSFLEMWIPPRYWKDSPRNAAVYTLNRLNKERNNLLSFGDDDEEEEKE